MAQSNLHHRPRLVLVRKSTISPSANGSKSPISSKSSSRSSSKKTSSKSSAPIPSNNLQMMDQKQRVKIKKESHSFEHGTNLDLDVSDRSGISDVTDFTAETNSSGMRSCFNRSKEKIRSFRQSHKRVSFSDEVDEEEKGKAKKASLIQRGLRRSASTNNVTDGKTNSLLVDQNRPLNNKDHLTRMSMPEIAEEGSDELVNRYRGPARKMAPRALSNSTANAKERKSDLQILGETTKAIFSALRIGSCLGARFQIDHVQFTPRGCLWNAFCWVHPGHGDIHSQGFELPIRVTCFENKENPSKKRKGTKYEVEISLLDSYADFLWMLNSELIKKALEWIRCRIALYICKNLEHPFAPEVLVNLPQPLIVEMTDKSSVSGQIDENASASQCLILCPTPSSSIKTKMKATVKVEESVHQQNVPMKPGKIHASDVKISESEVEIMYPTPKSMLSKGKRTSSSSSVCSMKSAFSVVEEKSKNAKAA